MDNKNCVVCQQIRRKHPELTDRELFAKPTELYRYFILQGTSYCEVHLPDIEIYKAPKKK